MTEVNQVGCHGTYLWALAVLQDLLVCFFGGKEASAASVQVLWYKRRRRKDEKNLGVQTMIHLDRVFFLISRKHRQNEKHKHEKYEDTTNVSSSRTKIQWFEAPLTNRHIFNDILRRETASDDAALVRQRGNKTRYGNFTKLEVSASIILEINPGKNRELCEVTSTKMLKQFY